MVHRAHIWSNKTHIMELIRDLKKINVFGMFENDPSKILDMRTPTVVAECNLWSLGMNKWFHPTYYDGWNYLFMLRLQLNHVSERGPRYQELQMSQSHHDWKSCRKLSAAPSPYDTLTHRTKQVQTLVIFIVDSVLNYKRKTQGHLFYLSTSWIQKCMKHQ